MALLLSAILLWQEPSGEETLHKIEDTFSRARTLSVKITIAGTDTANGEDTSLSMSGTFLLKDKTKFLILFDRTDRGHEERFIVVSDGKTTEGHSKYMPDPVSFPTRPELRGFFEASFARGGGTGLVAMSAVFCGYVHNARGMEPDPKKLIKVSDFEKGSNAKEPSLSFTSKMGNFGPAQRVTLWYDSTTFKPTKGLIAAPGGADGTSLRETYEEFVIDGEVPDDRFRVPEPSDPAESAVPATAEEAREQIRRLRSENIDERNDAARKLKEFGKVALPELQKILSDKDEDVVSQAHRLIQLISLQEKLTPRLLRRLPGLDERLLGDDPHLWTVAFLQANEKDGINPALATLKKDDFEKLAGAALRGSRPGAELKSVLRVIRERELKTAGPELRGLLRSPDAETRLEGVGILGNLHLREASGDIRGLLGDPNSDVRGQTAEVLSWLKDRESTPAILKLLEDPEARVRASALEALLRLDAREASAMIVKMLSDKDSDVRWNAACALGEWNVKSAAPDLAKVLEGEDGKAIRGALMALSTMGATEQIPSIAKHLRNPSWKIRSDAIEALALLGAAGEGEAIAGLLKDENDIVRINALRATGSLEIRQALPEVLRLLEDRSIQVRVAALESLGRMEVREQIGRVEKMLSDSSDEVRQSAASTLCRLGSSAGVSALLYKPYYKPDLTCLNALRNPEAWSKLAHTTMGGDLNGSFPELLRAVAKAAGCTLELPDSFLEKFPETAEKRSFSGIGNRRTLLDALYFAKVGGYVIVLEPARMRVLDPEAGLAYWKTWWEGEKKK